jgi:exodeoxyribonuclease V beta subunit
MSRRTSSSAQLSLFSTAAPRYPRPQALRRLGEKNAVVEASAGTGKTYVLEHLVIDLLLSRGAKLEEILVVTFTEKATAELISRVRAKLLELSELRADHDKPTDLHWVIDEKARRALREALRSFDRANIFTIHGFCQRLLRDHAFFHQRLFDEQPMDGGEAWHAAFTTALRDHIASDAQLNPYLRAWVNLGYGLDDLEKLLRNCHEHLSGLHPERPHSLRPPFDEQAAHVAIDGWDRNAAEDEALMAKLKRAGVDSRSLKKMVRLIGLVNTIVTQRDLPSVLGGLSGIKKHTTYLLEKLSPIKDDPELGALATRTCALATDVPPLHAALAHRVLPVVRTCLKTHKQQVGIYDFQDMLTEVARSLHDPQSGHALLDTLRGRFRYALIDEFQDTDEVQWGIFRRIFFDSPNHVLTVIGDPKQAIYAFRGADVQTYVDARETLVEADGARVDLTENFRSTASVIDGYNAILSDFFRPEGEIGYDKPVTCGRRERRLLDGEGREVPGLVVFDVPAHGPELRAAEARAAVQAQIVAEIRRLQSDRPLFVSQCGDPQRVLERDIFVLTFTNGECREIGNVLRAAGIPFAFFKQDGLFQTPEAHDVLAVLRALDRPHDRGRRARALFSAFFGLSLPELATCGDLEAHQPPLRVLDEWHRLAVRGELATLFSRMLDDSGISCRLLFQGGGERALTNVQHVLEVLQSEASHTHCTFRELVAKLAAWVGGLRPPPGHEGNMQRLETDARAVQIMTVYKAKGLEAEVVFLYGGTGQAPRKSADLFVMHKDGQRVAYAGTLPADEKPGWSTERQDEQRRVLYVALTRACSRLYLPHYPEEFERLDGTYKPLNDRLRDMRDDPHLTWVPCDVGETEAAPPSSDLAAWRPPAVRPALSDGEFAPIRHQRSGFLVTSYTAVKSKHGGFVPAEQTGDHAAANEPATSATGSDDELPRGRQSGIFLHALLEELPLEPLAQGMAFDDWYDESRAELERIAAEQAWDLRWLPTAARLVHTTLTAPVQLGDMRLHALAGVDKTLRECEFLYPIPEADHPLLGRSTRAGQRWTVERGLVKGFMDFLFEYQGRIYVCDWKGDALPAWDADSVRGHCERNYEIQARLYALAVLRMAGIDSPDQFDERFGGVLYCFLRGRRSDDETRGLHFRRPDWATVLDWQRSMLGGEFWGLP